MDLRKNVEPKFVINKLYKYTRLQDSFDVNMLALVKGKPFVLDLKRFISEYVGHRKDVVEKCFDNLKNALDMKRIRSHSKESSDGKIFIAFIALILRAIIENVLGDFTRKNNLTIEKIIKERASSGKTVNGFNNK